MRAPTLLIAAAAVMSLVGCGAATPTVTPAVSPSTSVAPPSASAVPSPRVPAPPVSSSTPSAGSAVSKVLVVVEENHSLSQMRAQMPYLAGLAGTYGYATSWKALAHPSESNYLAMAGGSMFGVTDDGPPSRNASRVGGADNVFAQALRAGRTAGTYAESMPGSCSTTNQGDYAVRHNPWTYFAADRASCRKFDVSTATFVADARADNLPDVGFLIPNMVHDAHDASLAVADAWLRQMLAPVVASSDFTSGRLAVVVTADEDDRHSGNTVLTAVLTPHLHHVVVSTPLNHYSLTRFIADVLGVRPLLGGRGAPDLRKAFGF
ncbi:MAG: alkaline phosphatase family protein [Marmoricola sp.]